MNTHFINVKWNADGVEYGLLSSKHKVSAFPTSLFLDFNEVEHKRKTGFLDANGLLKLSKEVTKFLETDFQSISRKLLDNPNERDIADFLSDNIGMDFLSKKILFDKYIDLVGTEAQLETQSYDILIDNMHSPQNVEQAITPVSYTHLTLPTICSV